jgi:hypothetical protein
MLNPNDKKIPRKATEMSEIEEKDFKKVVSTGNLGDYIDPMDKFNKGMQILDFFQRMIAVTLITEEDKSFDFDPQFYNEKSNFKVYTHQNIPKWMILSSKDISKLNY